MSQEIASRIAVMDIFCGIGGLSYGLKQAGLQIAGGYDNNPELQFLFESNHNAPFHCDDIRAVSASKINSVFGDEPIKLLCAGVPCTPFSPLQNTTYGDEHPDWNFLQEIQRIIQELTPNYFVIENVPRIRKQDIWLQFKAAMTEHQYKIQDIILNALDYNVPQHRKRALMIGSRASPVKVIPGDLFSLEATVREAIADLPPIEAGGTNQNDPLHRASGLSPLNITRIQASKPGGTWRDWDQSLWTERMQEAPINYRAFRFLDMSGRMEWDAPAPTITTKFYDYQCGRFGHPEQDRAISLREGALLQGFPADFVFHQEEQPTRIAPIARLIGNAVPPPLGKAIGESIIEHQASLT